MKKKTKKHTHKKKTNKQKTCIKIITKTHLFKYIENFITENWKFSDKNSDIFSTFLLKT